MHVELSIDFAIPVYSRPALLGNKDTINQVKHACGSTHQGHERLSLAITLVEEFYVFGYTLLCEQFVPIREWRCQVEISINSFFMVIFFFFLFSVHSEQ